jgi:thiamine biosynthesis lipoprotein
MRARVAAGVCLLVSLGLSCQDADTARARPYIAPPSAAPSSPVLSEKKPGATFTPKRGDFNGQAMGTQVHFVAYTTPQLGEAKLDEAMRAAHQELLRIETLMTSWRDTSEIGQVNLAARQEGGKPVHVSDETFSVLEKSRWAGDVSGGTFDITFHALSDLWGFWTDAEHEPKLPDPKVVAKQKKLVDYRKVKLDAATHMVTLPAGTKIDLGGIAKGYAVGEAAKVLQKAGVTSFLVQAGGDLYGAGKKPDGSPWITGIQDPRGPRGQFFATIELGDHAFSTAGDYEHFFILDGKRYHHIIDPRTGYPATACRSVTVWAGDAFTADAVDDAVFILGPEKGLKMVESLPDVGAVIVDSKNKVWVSKRLTDKVKVLHPPTDGI